MCELVSAIARHVYTQLLVDATAFLLLLLTPEKAKKAMH
jgi:hypothetical protein